MSIQIDQSGKIEDTSKPTVIALASKKISRSILLQAEDKRLVQTIYRKTGKPRLFVLQVFSALIYLLIERCNCSQQVIIIDHEYPGHEELIRSYIMQLIHKYKNVKIDPHHIRFGYVGKHSQAHKIANTGLYHKKADSIVTFAELRKVLRLYER